MVPPGPGMATQAMVPGSSGQMHPRLQRPSSQTGSVFISCMSNDEWCNLEYFMAWTVQ